jgi:hypothetical protein
VAYPGNIKAIVLRKWENSCNTYIRIANVPAGIKTYHLLYCTVLYCSVTAKPTARFYPLKQTKFQIWTALSAIFKKSAIGFQFIYLKLTSLTFVNLVRIYNLWLKFQSHLHFDYFIHDQNNRSRWLVLNNNKRVQALLMNSNPFWMYKYLRAWIACRVAGITWPSDKYVYDTQLKI